MFASAHIKAGETVLIHAGGSGVGTAAVQLVKLAGARALVTAGTQEKIDFAKTLGASDGFNYKGGSFAKHVLDATGGQYFKCVRSFSIIMWYICLWNISRKRCISAGC